MINFTCNLLAEQMYQWHFEASESFAPAYPTSIRGNDQKEYPGHR